MKAGSKRFEAIFVGYEDARIGEHVRDLKGKYSFSQDVIFNEDLLGRLGIPHSMTGHSVPAPLTSADRPSRDCTHTHAGRAFDEVVCLKEFRKAEL